jgi:amidase
LTVATALTAVGIAAQVRARTVSAEAVVRAHLDVIAQRDGALHALQLVRSERAVTEARAVDARADLAELPLAGVPVVIKDTIDLAGEPTRNGSAGTSSQPAEVDDALVTRLRAAGAIPIAKSTLPELAMWAIGESAAFGVTRNPWNRACSPGGSTAGGAAAVAAGMAPLTLGTDGGGSLRVPAAYCGLVGLKPGAGVVPVVGGREPDWYGMSEAGPMATTVADAALMLDVLAGTTAFREVRRPEKPLRIALSLRSPQALVSASREVETAVRACAAALSSAGHTVTSADPPYSLLLGTRWMRLWLAGVAQSSIGLDERALEPRTRTAINLGRRFGPGNFEGVAQAWASRAGVWFAPFDVALMPTVAQASMPAAGWTGRGFASTLLAQIRQVPFTQAWNLARFPAAAVPWGIGSGGVPLSVQIVAPPGGEGLVLSVALELERLRPWPRHAPAG